MSGRRLPWHAIRGVLKRLASSKVIFWEPGLRERAWRVVQRSLENISEEEKRDPRSAKLSIIVRGRIGDLGAVDGHVASTLPLEEAGTGIDIVSTWTEEQFEVVPDGGHDSFTGEDLD